MQQRICEKCGTKFNWQSAGNFVLENVQRLFSFLAALGATFLIVDLICHSWANGWVIFLITMVIGGSIGDAISKKGAVVTAWKCPSCGGTGVDPNSPLGKELELRWKEPHADAGKSNTV